jgi:hypothetical protein
LPTDAGKEFPMRALAQKGEASKRNPQTHKYRLVKM